MTGGKRFPRLNVWASREGRQAFNQSSDDVSSRSTTAYWGRCCRRECNRLHRWLELVPLTEGVQTSDVCTPTRDDPSNPSLLAVMRGAGVVRDDHLLWIVATSKTISLSFDSTRGCRV
jgi:hypothetical protein